MKAKLLKKLRKEACKRYKVFEAKNKYFVILDGFWGVTTEFNNFKQAKDFCSSRRRDYILDSLRDYRYNYMDKNKKLIF